MQKSLRCKDSRLGFGILILFGISLVILNFGITRLSALQAPEKDSEIHAALSSLNWPAWLKPGSLRICCLKMYPACYLMTEGGHLRRFLTRWTDWGMAWNGNVPTPNLSQITENLYNDLPDAPTGSYLGSMGLPVATGETKIGISAWVSDLYDGVDAHMDADALNADENTVTIGKIPGTDYAIVPLLAQVEYPADGAVSEIILPDDVELLSYLSTDYEPILADEQEQAEILHQTYSEQSAAATGLYVKASADFTAQLVYTDSDGSSQSKSIHVQISEDAAPTQIRRYQQELDDAKAEYAELQNARLNEAAEIRKLRTYYDDFKGWAEEFDTAPLEMKRMILSHLIDRVEVGRKYQVIVKFNMKYRQFLECTAETYNTEIGA